MGRRKSDRKSKEQRLDNRLTSALGGSTLRRFVESGQERTRKAAQEKEEHRLREGQKLAELRAIRQELSDERSERDTLAAQSKEQAEATAHYRTGLPGRPGSSHLIIEEFQRRADAKELEPTLRTQAKLLLHWLATNHPSAAPIKLKTAENALRDLYRKAKNAAP